MDGYACSGRGAWKEYMAQRCRATRPEMHTYMPASLPILCPCPTTKVRVTKGLTRMMKGSGLERVRVRTRAMARARAMVSSIYDWDFGVTCAVSMNAIAKAAISKIP